MTARVAPSARNFPLDIVGSTQFGRYPKISTRQTYNMIITEEMSSPALVGYAGYKKKSTISTAGVGREIYKSTRYNHLIIVINDGVYTVSTDLAVSKINNLETFTGNVFMAENNNGEIGIVDGLNVYIFNYFNNTFTTVNVDFLPVYIAFQDGYFICADGRTNQWRLSAPNDGTSWPNAAPNVGVIATKPDFAVAIAPLGRQLFVFGKTCAEPWYDVGYSLFPYQLSNFYSVDYGCLSAATVATLDDKLVWLGANEKSGPAIMVSTGGMPKELSDDGINFKLAELTAPEDSYGFLFRQDGRVFYQITFVTDNLTYTYDFNSNKFYTLSDHKLDYHIAKRVAFFNNSYYFISFNDGCLYELSSEYTNYDGVEIPRFRICSNIRMPDASKFILNSITLTLEQGESTSSQAIDLGLSTDGGVSYGSNVRQQFNALGRRPNKMSFWNLGMANDVVPKFGFWGLDRFVIIGAEASIFQ